MAAVAQVTFASPQRLPELDQATSASSLKLPELMSLVGDLETLIQDFDFQKGCSPAEALYQRGLINHASGLLVR